MSRAPVTSRDVESGEVVVHQYNGTAGYHTLCGVSLTDDQFVAVPTPRRTKIDCAQCREIWTAARDLRASDFKDTK